MISDVAQNVLKFFKPLALISSRTACHTPETRIGNHLFRTDMDFLPLTELCQQFHMETLIAVFLRRIYIIVDTLRLFFKHIGKQRIDTQCHSLIGNTCIVRENYSDEMTMLSVKQISARRLHLAPNTVRHAILHLDSDIDTIIRHYIFDHRGKFLQTLCISRLVFFQRLLHLRIFQRTTITHAQIFQFCLNGIKSETICQRSIKIVCLAGYFHLLVSTHTVESSHIVHTVGKLNKYRTYIILHRIKHLLEIIQLLGHDILILLLLGDDIYQKCHIIAKHFFYFLNSIVSILNNIMQKSSYHCIGIELQLHSHNLSDLHRMNDIRLARFARLTFMRFICKLVSLLYSFQISFFNTRTHRINNAIYFLSILSCVISFHCYLPFNR